MNLKYTTLFLALALTVAAPMAQAGGHCEACIRTTINEAGKTNSRIDQMRDAVVQAVDRAHTGIVGALSNATGALAEQQSQAVKATAENDIARSKAEAKIGEATSRPPLTCSAASSANAATGGGGTGQRFQKPEDFPERLAQAADASGQTDTPLPAPRDPSAQAADIFVGSMQKYGASGTPAIQQIAEAQGVRTEGAADYPSAHMNADTLFNGPQASLLEMQKMRTVPAKGPERDAVIAAQTLADDPLPPPTPTLEQQKKPEAAAWAGVFSAYKSASEIARFPMTRQDRLTTADLDNADAVKALMDDDITSQWIQNYYKNSANPQGWKAPSHDELMFIESERRIGNPDWIKWSAGASEAEVMKEIMMMLAMQMRQQRELIEEMRINSLIAGRALKLQADEYYRPQLDQAMTVLTQSPNIQEQ